MGHFSIKITPPTRGTSGSAYSGARQDCADHGCQQGTIDSEERARRAVEHKSRSPKAGRRSRPELLEYYTKNRDCASPIKKHRLSAASNSYTPTNSRMRIYTPGILGNSDADEASAALYVSQTNLPGEFTRIPLLPEVMRALMKPLLALTDSMYLRVVLTISGRVKRREGACIFRVGPTPVRCISATL